jgi:hypothetical protein
MVFTEVWYWVIDIVAQTSLFVLVLSTSCRSADWVRLGVSIHISSCLEVFNNPMVIEIGLSIFQVLLSCSNIGVNNWIKIIKCIFSFIMIFFIACRVFPIMSHVELSFSNRVLSVNNIFIHTKMWDIVVNWVSKTSSLLLELSASSGRANWI